MPEQIRKHIIFYGRVQGVGFRWHARQAADSYHLTGWVRNDYDGSVTMEVQGRPEAIDLLLQHLSQARYIDITSMDIRNIAADPSERSFRVHSS